MKKIIIVVMIFGIFLYGCVPTSTALRYKKQTSIDEWKKIREEDIANVSNSWKAPIWFERVNTTGWEDGPYISPDGNTLYFAYINIDLFKLPDVVVIGPNRDLAGVGNPPCGQFPRPDEFYSTKDTRGNWQTPVPHPVTIPYPVGGFVFANEKKVYLHMEKDDGLHTEIYSAEKVNGVWQSPEKIVALSSPHKDDDPHIMPNDEELFFWSDRPAALRGNNIYYSKKVNGQWQNPVLLPKPINSNSSDMQPFVFGDTLYFSSDRDGKMKIYKSALKDNKWSPPEVVVSSKHGVGEPTLTRDGKFLYFIQIFVSEQGEHNTDIMYCERK